MTYCFNLVTLMLDWPYEVILKLWVVTIKYGFFLGGSNEHFDISHTEMAHQSLCGEYLNLSNVPSISVVFQTNAI